MRPSIPPSNPFSLFYFAWYIICIQTIHMCPWTLDINRKSIFFISTKLTLILEFVELLKVSKSQKNFFLQLHCPKNERNIWQNFALASFFEQWSFKKNYLGI